MNSIKEIITNDNNLSSSRSLPFSGQTVLDKNNEPVEGTITLKDGTVCHFHNGVLDGNIYDEAGKIKERKPAMEYSYGGTEFCENGVLEGYPAVIQCFGYHEEDWKNGEIQAVRDEIKIIPEGEKNE